MTDNMRLWKALSKTDPNHTKPFKRAGGFQGTAIKPIWLIMRLTEQFGPAGTGWGMGKPEFQTVAANDEILVFCTISLWYAEPVPNSISADKICTVYGVGGDKVLGKNKYGPFTNDEAFKASYTDALSNAMKQIGMSADIHMGLFDDEKYVREAAREYAKPPAIDAVHEEDRGLVKEGETRSTYDIGKRKAAENFAAAALSAFEGLNGSTINDWYRTPISPKGRSTNRDALDRMRESFPDLADKVDAAAEEVRLRNAARLQ